MEVDKGDLDAQYFVEKFLKEKFDVAQILPQPPSLQLQVEIQQKLLKAWERHINTPLHPRIQAQIRKEFLDDLKRMENNAKINFELRKQHEQTVVEEETVNAGRIIPQAVSKAKKAWRQSFRETLQRKITQEHSKMVDKRRAEDPQTALD